MGNTSVQRNWPQEHVRGVFTPSEPAKCIHSVERNGAIMATNKNHQSYVWDDQLFILYQKTLGKSSTNENNMQLIKGPFHYK